MTWYNVVLFLHLLTVAAAFYAIAVMMSALMRIPACRRVSEAGKAITRASSIGKMMPIVVVLLLLTGGFMTQTRWMWTTGWIDVSILGLLLVTVTGAGFIGSRDRAVHRRLAQMGSETLTPEAAAQLLDPPIVLASGINLGLVAGVMFVMVMKSSTALSLAALVVGAAIGYILLAGCVRTQRARAASTLP